MLFAWAVGISGRVLFEIVENFAIGNFLWRFFPLRADRGESVFGLRFGARGSADEIAVNNDGHIWHCARGSDVA